MTGNAGQPEDDDLLAAELALGLLDADEAASARLRARDDPGFRAALERWEARAATGLALLEVSPRPGLWLSLRRRLDDQSDPIGEPRTTRRLRVWQSATAVASLIAASMTIVVALRPAPPRIAPSPAAPAQALVAVLIGEKTQGVVAMAYDRATGQLTLVPKRLTLAGRSAELWVLPKAGQPVAVSLVPASKSQRAPARPQARRYFEPGAAFAISLESAGGSPTGAPTGPIILSGAVSNI